MDEFEMYLKECGYVEVTKDYFKGIDGELHHLDQLYYEWQSCEQSELWENV